MKSHHALFLALPLLVFSSLSFAAPNCAIKEQKIRTQLDYATRYGNVNRIEGLNRALANVQRYCYGGYKYGYNRYDYIPGSQSVVDVNHQSLVAEKQRKVAKRQEKLYKAQIKGKPSKIAKQQRKLEEAEFELRQAQALLK